MGKGKTRETIPSGAPLDALRDLVRQALESDTRDSSSPLLQQLKALSPLELSHFTTMLAKEGQERALPVLLSLTGSQSMAPAAAEALGWVRSQEAANHLAPLADASPSKEVRKSAGRALHRLRSVGLQPRPAAAPPVQTPPVTPVARPRSRAWASSVDGAGSRFLFITVPEPLGGHRNLVFLMINDLDGIREARVGHAETDAEASARVDTVARESGLPHVEVPIDYARHLVTEGRERARHTGHPLPTEYMVWKEAIGEPEDSWNHPPVYQELNAAQILMEPGLLEESPRLLDLREFANWRLDTEHMRPYAEELERAKGGMIVLPGPAEAEREERLLEKAMEDLLHEDGRSRYRRRLEEMSYLLLHTGREREAKSALAAAVAMEQDGRQSSLYLPGSRATDFTLGDRSALARHPFLRRLLVESLNMALDRISRGRKLIVAG